MTPFYLSKKTTRATALLIATGLFACQPSPKKADTPTAKPVESVAQAEQKSVVDAAQLGVFSGAFDATSEQIERAKAFEKELEGGPARELKEVPEQYHAYVYQDPLYGDYRIAPPNRVSLVIEGLYADKTVKGTSIAAGNMRSVSGQWQQEGGKYTMVLKEPGDNPNDGAFKVTLNPADGLLKGHWQSKDGATNKNFALKRMAIKVNPKSDAQREFLSAIYDDVEEKVKDPSIDLLQNKDVENLTRPQIRMLRNLVYARHGASFESKPVRYTFEGLDWYVPRTLSGKVQLTDIETHNLEVLKRYETYAADTYNSFGR